MYYGRYGGFAPYKSVQERKKEAEKTIAKKMKNGEKISPVRIEGRSIAGTFWGKAWCNHLESFSDYANRLPRGRSYVRHGAVIHLGIEKGKIEAMVQGSSMYKIQITIAPVAKEKWNTISKRCSGEIGSVIELLQGKLSSTVMKTITDQQQGLFPLPKEISLKCSCPDWAGMCKHVAAVLYGVGARLDHAPELLFTLRNADHMELISTAALKAGSIKPTTAKTVADQDLAALFGIDMDTGTQGDVEVQVQAKPPKETSNPASGKKESKPKEKKAKPNKNTVKAKPKKKPAPKKKGTAVAKRKKKAKAKK